MPNLTNRPHRLRTRTVHSYSPGCANVRPHAALCFLGPIRVHNPNGILIGLAVFTGLTIVTDGPTNRPTDRQTTLLGL